MERPRHGKGCENPYRLCFLRLHASHNSRLCDTSVCGSGHIVRYFRMYDTAPAMVFFLVLPYVLYRSMLCPRYGRTLRIFPPRYVCLASSCLMSFLLPFNLSYRASIGTMKKAEMRPLRFTREFLSLFPLAERMRSTSSGGTKTAGWTARRTATRKQPCSWKKTPVSGWVDRSVGRWLPLLADKVAHPASKSTHREVVLQSLRTSRHQILTFVPER